MLELLAWENLELLPLLMHIHNNGIPQNIFFQIHAPTTLNSQGPDFGTQYRSEIFYLNYNQKLIAEKILKEVNKKLLGKVVTKISLLKNYCPAEEYHQRYLEKR